MLYEIWFSIRDNAFCIWQDGNPAICDFHAITAEEIGQLWGGN